MEKSAHPSLFAGFLITSVTLEGAGAAGGVPPGEDIAAARGERVAAPERGRRRDVVCARGEYVSSQSGLLGVVVAVVARRSRSSSVSRWTGDVWRTNQRSRFARGLPDAPRSRLREGRKEKNGTRGGARASRLARARPGTLAGPPDRARMPPSARAVARASARLRRALASATPASAAPDDGILRVASRGRAFPRTPALPEPSLARSYAAGIARERTAVTAQLWRARMDAARAAGVFDTDAATKPQDALVPKPPRRHTVRYDFAANEDLREAYRNPWNAVRVGRLLEDLDSLAGNIAFEHCDDADRQTRPQLLVTASVDRVRLIAPLTLDADVVLAGAVAWVGRSSMVIRMEAWPADEYDGAVNTKNADEHSGGSPPEGLERSGSVPVPFRSPRSLGPSLTADFTFVARDPVTNKGGR